MKRRVAAVSLFGIAALSYWWLSSATAGGQNFDKLNDADRKVFAERFEREVWPLLVRGGKDGCVGCHRGGKIVSALRFSGNVDKDFLMLLKDGFFLHPDDGSLLARLTDKDAERRMPHKLKPWEEKDIAVLRSFVLDLKKKERSKSP
jgi:hypothetical protein